MSFFVICDGKNFKIFETAQDHKRVNEEIWERIPVEWVRTVHQD